MRDGYQSFCIAVYDKTVHPAAVVVLRISCTKYGARGKIFISVAMLYLMSKIMISYYQTRTNSLIWVAAGLEFCTATVETDLSIGLLLEAPVLVCDATG